MKCKIVRFQKLMWRNMIRSTKSQKTSVLHYSIDTCDFKSKVFDDYCLSIKIGVKHLVAHTILNII